MKKILYACAVFFTAHAMQQTVPQITVKIVFFIGQDIVVTLPADATIAQLKHAVSNQLTDYPPESMLVLTAPSYQPGEKLSDDFLIANIEKRWDGRKVRMVLNHSKAMLARVKEGYKQG